MGWTLVDFRVIRPSEPVVPGTFSTTIACDQVPVGYVWRVERITAWAPGEAFNVLVFDQPVSPNSVPADFANLGPIGNITQAGEIGKLIGTSVGVFDESSPITVLGGDALTLVFLAPLEGGDPVQARIQYQVLEGTAAAPQPVLGRAAPAIPAGI